MTYDSTRDPMALLRRSNPVQAPPAFDATSTTALLNRAQAAAPAPQPRRRRSLAVTASLSAVALTGATGAAYAVYWQSADTALQIDCAVGTARADFERFGGGGSILSTSSGDPVQDCAAEYRRLEGGQAPELRAYEHGKSFITVVPADWLVPQDWQPLNGAFRTDPLRVELESRLSDQIEGPEATCSEVGAADRQVRAELADLGLTGWTVERLEQANRADGTSWCAIAFLDGSGGNTVLLQGLEREEPIPGTTDSVDGITVRLRTAIVEKCLALPEARVAAEQAVRDSGASVSDAIITTLADPAATCTRVDFVPAGLISIVLRGPAS